MIEENIETLCFWINLCPFEIGKCTTSLERKQKGENKSGTQKHASALWKRGIQRRLFKTNIKEENTR